MSDNNTNERTKKKNAAAIAPVVRERAVQEFGYYGSTRIMQRRDKLSRSDLQDLVLLGLLDEIRRLRPLQRSREAGSWRGLISADCA